MKVNILMSTYNGETYLAEQIESIQNQTYTDWQLLIRDDGSSDQTRQLIAKYAEKDERIRFINPNQNDNYGVIKSFYTLVKYEKADYYFFSDQDDVWLPDKVETQLKEAENYPKNELLMVYMDLKVVNQQLETISDSMIRSQSGHANTAFVQELTENTVTGGVAMINHALAEKWQSLDNIIMHDWYLALLATAYGRLVYIDKPGELYRQHDNNVLGARTWGKRIKKWLRPHFLFKLYWDLIKATQKQAQALITDDLSPSDRELAEAFISVMSKSPIQRYRTLKKYNLRKNKAFHTFVFSMLIITRFGYRRK